MTDYSRNLDNSPPLIPGVPFAPERETYAASRSPYMGDDASDVAALKACKTGGADERYASDSESQPGDADAENAKWEKIPGLEDDDKSRRTVRRYLIEMHFSMASAEENPASVEWNVNRGMYYAFKKRAPDAAPGSARAGNLERALLLGGAVHQAKSSAPCTLLVQFAGMRGNRYTSSGLRAPFWVLPGQNTVFQPAQIIFKPDDAVYSMQVKNYSHLSEDDITGDIMPFHNEPYGLVPKNHAVTRVVRMNQELIGIDLDTMTQAFGRYKMHNRLITKCQNTLRQQVLEVMPFTDLSCWKVRLERADGLRFGDETNIEELGEDEEIGHELMTKMNQVIIDLELTFLLCGDSTEATAEQTPK